MVTMRRNNNNGNNNRKLEILSKGMKRFMKEYEYRLKELAGYQKKYTEGKENNIDEYDLKYTMKLIDEAKEAIIDTKKSMNEHITKLKAVLKIVKKENEEQSNENTQITLANEYLVQVDNLLNETQ